MRLMGRPTSSATRPSTVLVVIRPASSGANTRRRSTQTEGRTLTKVVQEDALGDALTDEVASAVQGQHRFPRARAARAPAKVR